MKAKLMKTISSVIVVSVIVLCSFSACEAGQKFGNEQRVCMFDSPDGMTFTVPSDLPTASIESRTEMSIENSDSTVVPKSKMKLLPDNLSPMESFLWGEGGIMRSTGWFPLTPESRKSELGVRRTMLTAHQIGGFLTFGLFIPTLIIGQRNLTNWNNASNGGRLDRKLNNLHQMMGMLTFSSYMATASLAIFAPPPLIRRGDWSTTTLHKTLAWVHFVGMIATPILGSLSGSKSLSLSAAQNLRTIHQITAYTTFAAFSASMIILTF